LKDNDCPKLTPEEMLRDLLTDNRELTRFMRGAHGVCERQNDMATTSLIEVWIDETERRTWFVSEILGKN
jgi:starvation-inducible DNA-binding protein